MLRPSLKKLVTSVFGQVAFGSHRTKLNTIAWHTETNQMFRSDTGDFSSRVFLAAVGTYTAFCRVNVPMIGRTFACTDTLDVACDVRHHEIVVHDLMIS